MKLPFALLLVLNFSNLTEFSHASGEPGYCLAIRGNGELVGAHWGAMARLAEERGLPERISGGSSAAVSAFLLDSISQNPLLKEAQGEEKKAIAAFLIKSLQGFANRIAAKGNIPLVASLFGKFKEVGALAKDPNMKTIEELAKKGAAALAALTPEERKSLTEMNEFLKKNQLINKDAVGPLLISLQKSQDANFKGYTKEEAEQLKFYAGELHQSVSAFGAFNAENDSNLLFREGILNFDSLATQIGSVGSFYAGKNWDTKTKEEFKKAVSDCTKQIKGKSWNQTTNSSAGENCKTSFENSVDSYFAQNIDFTKKENNVVFEKVGTHTHAVIGTAVIQGKGADQFEKARIEYHTQMDPKFGDRFALNNPTDLKFGYFGSDEDLKKIEQEAKKSNENEKMSRTLTLPGHSWFDALRLSPAEPGLARAREFNSAEQKLLSVGGWSDLHPTDVLESSGCKERVYLTRKGGESLFAQGVAKRIWEGRNFDTKFKLVANQDACTESLPTEKTAIDMIPEINEKISASGVFGRPWEELRTSPIDVKNKNAELNDRGDPNDKSKTLWNRLYNLGNDESSMRKSLDKSTIVICTDWNKFEISDGLEPMIQDSLNAPWILKDANSSFAKDLGKNPNLKPSKEFNRQIMPGCI